MYRKKLQARNWFIKRRLDRNGFKVSNQVADGSLWSMFLSYFTKISILAFFGLLILFPFYYMISLSLMSDQQIIDMQSGTAIYLVPDAFNYENFEQAAKSGYWTALIITFINVLVSVIMKIGITMLLGYAFSLPKWKGKKFMWRFFLTLLILPEVALLAGQFQVVVNLGLRNQAWTVVLSFSLPFVASIFNAMMYRNAFQAIPGRIKEVSLVDGATGVKYFFKVAVPMVVPTTLTITILTALAAWNAFLWPSLIATSTDATPVLSTWLFLIGQRTDNDGNIIGTFENIRMAGAIFVIFPMFVVYFIFRSRVMNAISRQGATIKG